MKKHRLFVVFKDGQTGDRLFNSEEAAVALGIEIRRAFPTAQIAILEVELEVVNVKALPKLLVVPGQENAVLDAARGK